MTMKIRLKLCFVIALLAFGGKEAFQFISARPSQPPPGWQMLAMFALTAISFSGLPAAVAMFAFSFFKMENINSKLVYDPQNPYVRLMRWFYQNNWGWGPTSLCKAYWQTVFMAFVAELAVGIVILFTYAIRYMISTPFRYDVPLPDEFYDALKLVAIMVVGIALMSTYERRPTGKIGLVLFFTSLVYGIAWGYIEYAAAEHTTVLALVLQHLLKLVAIATSIGAVSGLSWLGFRLYTAFRTTALGQLAIAMKEDFCPLAYPGND